MQNLLYHTFSDSIYSFRFVFVLEFKIHWSLTDDKSALFQVMIWRHYRNQLQHRLLIDVLTDQVPVSWHAAIRNVLRFLIRPILAGLPE